MDNDLNSIFEIGKTEETAVSGSAETYQYVKDPARLTNTLKTTYWIVISICVIAIISDLMQLNLIERIPITRAQAEANDSRQLVIFIISLIAGITNKVFFFIWLYRANLNCAGFKAAGMRFTPGWAVGWFFIPFANFFKPYQVIKEIWHVSDDPKEWQTNSYRKSSALPVAWWSLWITGAIVSFVSFSLARDVRTISELKTSTGFAIFADIFFIPCNLVFLSLVTNIFTRQNKLVGKPSDTGTKDQLPIEEFFCSECKEPVKADDKFCHKCGANLEETTLQKEENQI